MAAEILAKANAETDLEEAMQMLAPKAIQENVWTLRNTIHGATLAYEKQKRTYATADDNPNYIHNCVNAKATFQIPYSAKHFPNTLAPIHQAVCDSLDQENARYRKTATAIIHKGHQLVKFQNRMERISLLCTQLIHSLGKYHAMEHRGRPTDNDQPDYTPTAMAIVGIRRLLDELDTDMLKFLDINRKQLTEFFDMTYNPAKFADLSDNDKATATFVTDTIHKYLKLATCKLQQAQLEQDKATDKDAYLLAEFESDRTSRATKAVAKAITQQELPKDAKALKDFFADCFKENNNKLSKKRAGKPGKNTGNPSKKAKAQANNNNTQSKGKAGRKAPTAAAKPKGSKTNNKGRKGNKKGKGNRN